ncbi:MAG: uracil-DNA glycosylase [Methyloprofundus sp.]|nr:uracil-DNA glycosylase [Methyloprofundus sp.]
MNNSIRLQYLSAMDIDVWVPRNAEYIEQVATEIIEPLDDSWAALNAEIKICEQCELCQARQQAVCGTGDQQADFLWVTDAPSLQDEQQGAAFSDQSAELFGEMLRAMQFDRKAIFTTHSVKCRPANDNHPNALELATCQVFLEREIALLKPKMIFAVGRIAAQQLLQSKLTMTELRQGGHEYKNIPVVVIYHPAYLLRKLSEKAVMWQDLQRALTMLNE